MVFSDNARAKTAHDWCIDIDQRPNLATSDIKHIGNLTLAIALLATKSQQSQLTADHELESIWSLIRDALGSRAFSNAQLKVNRSAQGFLAIPLCSVIVDGNIDLLFRLHVWLQDGQRGAPGFNIHSHQPFAQSWVLAGQGIDYTYDVKPVKSAAQATHARYALAWTSGAGLDAKYKTQQTYSKVVNTGDFMLANLIRTSAHTRNMSYSVPAASFHSSEVAPDMLHATLFMFDSSQGFVQDAPVLGPADSEHHTQARSTPGVSPRDLVALVDTARRYEGLLTRADGHIARSEPDQAFEALESAYSLSQSELVRFNHYDRTTPAIELCKTTTPQNRQRLEHLLAAGVDFERVDEHGCSALDYAVMNSDDQAEAIVLEALEQNLKQKTKLDLHRRSREAKLKKHFREVFVDIFRPLLLSRDRKSIRYARRAYASIVKQDMAKSRAFDPLKYVLFDELVKLGKFPRPADGMTYTYDPDHDDGRFFVFLSYRWMRLNPWNQQSNDEENIQYMQTLQAINEFLVLHPTVHPGRLCIWIDFACIDPDLPDRGVAALPLIQAQCDAMISLVDDKYYDRAWCCVEALIMHALQKAFGVHLWYEYCERSGADNTRTNTLLPGPQHLQIALGSKLLTFEEDRSRILFLEKQSRLLS
ncbi:hypothetical protein AMS68_006023 [Peltaster fructicola]|uniref:Heterokaryon incompatibility domain-containing protein n=1 Tax=Peltaster fructicola TaxID=286661 RepID=A0A6H0Y0Q0_9PEZI|nr:hypothetical protein AMS68_006023 [Peltaster fructicola]